MLRLTDIVKEYAIGDTKVTALKGVDLCFRRHEFVSVLGPSGCGKTTLLNIIGGLDRYTSGDLSVNGISTTRFSDADWDSYRNHSIGFVFQSYNLIPHQTVLANVELALTLSGVSRAERTRRAKEVLERVGLGDQLRKKPNQMSGGQMQRVAIARALVNDPEILLADEPTGALDSATSVQIMELLQEIAKDKLILMVTHNPELAERYSTRIIRLLDGRVVDDSAPYSGEEETAAEPAAPMPKADRAKKREQKKLRRTRSMSYPTAVSLSLNNLMTKKGRTLLTSFAGSIGIIGIALILSLSSGIKAYIDRVQEDTLSSYPITLEAESVDMSSLMLSLMGDHAGKEENAHALDRVYGSQVTYDMWNSLNTAETTENDLKSFKQWMDEGHLNKYVSAVRYGYDLPLNIYTKDTEGNIIRSDVQELMNELMKTVYGEGGTIGSSSLYKNAFSTLSVWQEMLPDKDGNGVSALLKEQYDVLAGRWPTAYNELVLVVDSRNEISDLVLYALGLQSTEDMKNIMQAAINGEEIDTSKPLSFSYEDILKMEFKLLPQDAVWQKNADGQYTDLTTTEAGLSYLYEGSDKAIPLKVVGILRQDADAASGMMTGAIGYTAALADHLIASSSSSALITAQLNDPKTDILTGLPFRSDKDAEPTAAEKAEQTRAYFAKLSAAEKAELYVKIRSVPTDAYLDAAVAQAMNGLDRKQLEESMIKAYAEQMGVADTSSLESYIRDMDDETLFAYARQSIRESVTKTHAETVQKQMAGMSSAALAAAFDTTAFTEEEYASFYDTYVPSPYSASTYEDNLKLLGFVDREQPTSIDLYAKTFADKDAISDAISAYNKDKAEEQQITYTDYVKLLMSSITTILSAITYVLIAFVAISLVVSSIMIGIITYISVLERTREIGILRAIGASKRDVSRVFNAETLLVGLTAGVMGIGITLLLTLPINAIVHHLTGIMTLNAVLPWKGAVLLVVISMVLTVVAGLIPAKIAARKDPVEALRSE